MPLRNCSHLKDNELISLGVVELESSSTSPIALKIMGLICTKPKLEAVSPVPAVAPSNVSIRDSVTEMIKTPRRKKSSTASNLSSLFGICEMISITEFEKTIIAQTWGKALSNTPYFGEHAYDRLMNESPSLRPLFGLTKYETNDAENVNHRIMSTQASRLRNFMNSLVRQMDDSDVAVQLCEHLGRKHADTVDRCSTLIGVDVWHRFGKLLLDEMKISLDTPDTEQKEMEMLAWKHFTSAIIQIMSDSYQQAMEMNSVVQNGSIAGSLAE